MPKISILLPTRGRPQLVKRLFESLVKTATDLDSIEVVLYMDEDDMQSHALSCKPLKIVKVIGRPGAFMGSIYRESYKVCNGRYIILMNDDAVFGTRGWDKAVVDAFARFPDDIALVYGNDLDQGQNVPTFPIISRSVCETIDGVCPGGYMNLHIESHLFDIFKRLRTMGHDRIAYLDGVIFEHLHYTLGKSGPDKTTLKKNPLADQHLFIELDDERGYNAARLARFIDGRKRPGAGKPCQSNAANQPPMASVLIHASYDTMDSLYRCYETLAKTHEKTPFEVIIVSSGPGEIAFASGGRISTKIICAPDGLNVSGMYNLGAGQALGEYLVFLDSAAVPKPGWLDCMVREAESNGNAGVIGCKQVNPVNGRLEHCGISFFRDGGSLRGTFIYRGVRAQSPCVNRVREFQAVSGACVFIRKAIFLKSGGFDEKLERLEEIDLCLKVRSRGLTAVYVPDSVIYYHGERHGRWHSRFLKDLSPIENIWGAAIKSDLEEILEQDHAACWISGRRGPESGTKNSPALSLKKSEPPLSAGQSR